MELKGKTALVTGAGVRLGRSLALALAGQGANLVLHYGTSRQAAEDTAAQIRTLGVQAALLQADLRDTSVLDDLIQDAAHQFGGLDILVNSAAIFESGGALDTSRENWEAHFSVNLQAPFFLSQAFAARLHPGQNAHIVNIADWRGLRPDIQHFAYSLTKAGLLSMTQALALALAPLVQVNAIAPGAILPPPGKDAAYLEWLAAEHIPLRRNGTPQEVAQAMLFLLQSDFITGETLFITGGEHLL